MGALLSHMTFQDGSLVTQAAQLLKRLLHSGQLGL
jgi:hypothetical protein